MDREIIDDIWINYTYCYNFNFNNIFLLNFFDYYNIIFY